MSGPIRRKSGEWSLHEKKTRVTLIPCPACKETGLQEGSEKPCRWCGGNKGVPKEVFGAFQRWLRIVAAARRAGRIS